LIGVNNNQILGIVLVVLGAILLLDRGSIAFVTPLLGVILLVVGILMLMGTLHGASWIAVSCIVLGILLILPGIPAVKALVDSVLMVGIIVVAVLLIIFGALKIAQKA
jgi:hypothetical protein